MLYMTPDALSVRHSQIDVSSPGSSNVGPPYGQASSQVSGSSAPQAPLLPPPGPIPGHPHIEDESTADIAAVPGLVDTLNRLIARLPRGAVHGEEEPPPMYHDA